MFKRTLKKVIVSTLVLGISMSNLVFANSEKQGLMVSEPKANITIEQNIEYNYDMLKKKEIKGIADYHVNNYLKSDFQTMNKKLKVSNNFINLYDLNENIIAYIVPLVESNKEIGFINIDAMKDGYGAYEIVIDEDTIKNLRSSIKKYNNQVKVLFIPPSGYILSVKEKFLKLDKANRTVDITNKVIEKKDLINSVYISLRNNKNKSENGIINKSSQVEDVRLVKEAWGQFVPVENGSHYGGYQDWYSDSAHQERGCGPTAASNINYYLANKNPSKYGSLYERATISKVAFTQHMDVMYSYLSPGPLGVTSISSFVDAMEEHADDWSVNLNPVYSNDFFTLDNTSNYIKSGLNSDSPVACLNLQPTGYDYGWHWMTITKYYRDANDNRWIAVSTWGGRSSINYKTWYYSTLVFGGGLIYFQ